jgi:hypothetical protein
VTQVACDQCWTFERRRVDEVDAIRLICVALVTLASYAQTLQRPCRSRRTRCVSFDRFIGRQRKDDEEMLPGPHAYDGSYSVLTLIWHGYRVKLRAAHADDVVMPVTPLSEELPSSLVNTVVFSAGLLWTQPGAGATANAVTRTCASCRLIATTCYAHGGRRR